MNRNGYCFLRLFALWIGAISSLTAIDFILPAEGPVAFRRDKIPLGAEAMATLSNDLNILARSLTGQSSEEKHAAAQMLALSLALDPCNAKARETLIDYQQKRHQPLNDASQIECSHANIWPIIGWLETPDVGRDGQALAACLKDVIVISDPKHPKAEAIIATGTTGVWEGWVPALSAYQMSAAELNQKVVAATPNHPKDILQQQPLVPNEKILQQAVIDTVLWKIIGSSTVPKWVYGSAKLQMTSKHFDPYIVGPDPFPITIGSGESILFFENTSRMLEKLMVCHFNEIPTLPSHRLSVTSPEP